jgi:hypothetical protein
MTVSKLNVFILVCDYKMTPNFSDDLVVVGTVLIQVTILFKYAATT